MMEYDVVIEDDDYALFLKRCNRMTKEGWRPQGGVSVSTYRSRTETDEHFEGYNTIYAQAFVKGDK